MSINLPDSEFKAYLNTGLEDVPIEALKYFSKRRLNDLYEIDTSYNGHTALEVVQHHQDVVKANNIYVLEYIIIIDRPDVAKEGVLIVHISPEDGFIDAVRQPASEAANIPPSLSISNTDWIDERIDISPKRKNYYPINWFAVYNLLPPTRQEAFQSALFFLDDGMTSLCYGLDSDEDEPNNKRQINREYYCPVNMDGEERNLDQTIAKHAQYARAHNLDPIHFAVVDDTEWEEKGILFVKVIKDDSVDRFRRKGPTAGEMLNWIFIGLMTWEEAKNWDSSWIGKKRVDSVSDEGGKKGHGYVQDDSLIRGVKQLNVHNTQSHTLPGANPNNFNPKSVQQSPSKECKIDGFPSKQDAVNAVTTKPRESRSTKPRRYCYRTKAGMEIMSFHDENEIGDKFWRELSEGEEIPAGVPYENCYGIIEIEDEIVEEIDASMITRRKPVEQNETEKEGSTARL